MVQEEKTHSKCAKKIGQLESIKTSYEYLLQEREEIVKKLNMELLAEIRRHKMNKYTDCEYAEKIGELESIKTYYEYLLQEREEIHKKLDTNLLAEIRRRKMDKYTDCEYADKIGELESMKTYYEYLLQEREEILKKLDMNLLAEIRRRKIDKYTDCKYAEKIGELESMKTYYEYLLQQREEIIKKLDMMLLAETRRRKMESTEEVEAPGLNCAELAVLALRNKQRKRKYEPRRSDINYGTEEGRHLMARPSQQGFAIEEKERKLNYAELAVLALRNKQRKRKYEPPTRQTKYDTRKPNYAEKKSPQAKRRRV